MFTVMHGRVISAPIGQHNAVEDVKLEKAKTFWHTSLIVAVSWDIQDAAWIAFHFEPLHGLKQAISAPDAQFCSRHLASVGLGHYQGDIV